MPTRKPPPKEQRPQSEDFIEAARKLGANESREAFEEVFKKLTTHAPALRVSRPPGASASETSRRNISASKKKLG